MSYLSDHYKTEILEIKKQDLYETFLPSKTFQLGTNVIYINPSPLPWLSFIEGRARGLGLPQ